VERRIADEERAGPRARRGLAQELQGTRARGDAQRVSLDQEAVAVVERSERQIVKAAMRHYQQRTIAERGFERGDQAPVQLLSEHLGLRRATQDRAAEVANVRYQSLAG